MYQFNPQDYGFTTVGLFPELQERYGNTTFIKIVVLDKERNTYHYTAVYNIGAPGDQRWEFTSALYEASRGDVGYTYSSRTVYSGLLSTEAFTKDLLMHLFGTTHNESVATIGLERFNSRLNDEWLTR